MLARAASSLRARIGRSARRVAYSRPRIRVSCVDQLGACRCHHGHKPGDVFDFDRDRGKMCAMACHVGFPYIDILRYGGTVPGNEPGTAKFCCPEVDTLNVWLAEIVDE